MEAAVRKIKSYVVRAGANTWALSAMCFIMASFTCSYLNFLPASYSPLGASAFIAVWLYSKNQKTVTISMLFGLLGALIFRNISGFFALLIILLFLSIWTFWQGAQNIKSRDKLLILAAANLICVIVFSFSTVVSCLLGLLNAGISLLIAVNMHNAFTILTIAKKRKRMLSNNEMISLCIFFSSLVLGFSGIRLPYVSLAAIMAICVSLIASYTCGVMGLCAAISCGLALALSCGNMNVILPLAVSAPVSSMLYSSNKFVAAFVFIATMYVFGAAIIDSFSVVDIIIGVVPFVLISNKSLRIISAYSTAYEMKHIVDEKISARIDGIATVVRVLRSLAKEQGTQKQISGQLVAVCNAFDKLTNFTIEEPVEPPKNYKLVIGTASASKHSGISTGDCIGTLSYDTSQMVLLSDGMGTGSVARKESELAVNTIFDLIQAGFEPMQALECANKLLIDSGNEEIYATIDTLVFDTANCTATIIKLGAPPSFIVRKGEIFAIFSESLPIGIVDEAKPHISNLKLREGDNIIMMTDGISDSLGASLAGTVLESIGLSHDVQKNAESILEAVMNGGVVDDMSIAVMVVSK